MNRNIAVALSLFAIWGSSAAAIIAGLYFTKDPKCLFGLIIPALMRVRTDGKPITK